MKNMRFSLVYLFPSSLLVLLLSGCGGQSPLLSPAAPASVAQGSVYGGMQPITGASVVLYAVNTSTTGGSSSSIMTSTVTTDSNGAFTLTGKYTCPTASSLVYLLITGGNPGLSAANPDIALMAAIGQCSTLTSSSFISVNELTTVGAVYALAPFITSGTAIGSTTSNATTLAADFTLASEYVNVPSGSAPGLNVPTGMIPPTVQLNTVADAIYSCVNSAGGTAGDNNSCGKLFTATTPSGGPAPTDTIGAALNIALNPTTVSPSAIFALVTANTPYNPSLTAAPADWTAGLVSAASSYVLATGDSRRVSQPTYPAVCQTLTAQFTTSQRTAPPASASDDTNRIQAALTACKNTGQSIVLAVSGTNTAFFSNMLTVTGETLVINSGVTLYGNDSYVSNSQFLYLTGINTGLMGPGTVDGRGDVITTSNTPRLVQTTNASNLIVYNVTLTQAIHPNLYVQGGNGATVWGVTVLTPANRANADGIDIDSITNVTVTNSSIEAGDDGVAVKCNNSNTSNITVSNNKIYGTHGYSIGSITGNTVSNVLFQSNYVYGNGNYFSGVNSTDANAINIKTYPCTLTVQQISYVNTCITTAKHLIILNTNYGVCGGGGGPTLADIIVNGAYSNSSVSGAYETFDGQSGYNISGYLANINLDSVSLSGTNQYGAYFLYNTNITPAGTGITTSSFTPPTGSVPSCTF